MNRRLVKVFSMILSIVLLGSVLLPLGNDCFAVDKQGSNFEHFSVQAFIKKIEMGKSFYLADIVPFEWETVYIYRRPLDWTLGSSPDLERIRGFCPSFNISDNVSLMLYENQGAIVGYTVYPAYSVLEFLDHDGVSVFPFVSFRQENAVFTPYIVYDEELKANVIYCVLKKEQD